MKDKKTRIRGQFYIIAALILILFMFYARYNTRFEIPESIDYTQGLFSNMKMEVLRSVSSSYYIGPYSRSVENNVSSFLDFLRNVSDSHGQKMEALVIVMIPRSSSYNVSVINFLIKTVDVNISVAGIEQNTTNLADKASARFIFNGVPENATVNVTYVRDGVKSSDEFNISARKLNTYADMKLISSLATWSDRVIG